MCQSRLRDLFNYPLSVSTFILIAKDDLYCNNFLQRLMFPKAIDEDLESVGTAYCPRVFFSLTIGQRVLVSTLVGVVGMALSIIQYQPTVGADSQWNTKACLRDLALHCRLR